MYTYYTHYDATRTRGSTYFEGDLRNSLSLYALYFYSFIQRIATYYVCIHMHCRYINMYGEYVTSVLLIH